MKLQSINSSVVSRKRPKVVEWVPRKASRGTRYIPVDVSTSTSRPTVKRNTAGIKKDGKTSQETNPGPMEFDETVWMDEPATPEPEKQKRVGLPLYFP
jgi:hypothetical protein